MSYYSLCIKRPFSNYPKIILRDRPIAPYVTNTVESIKFDTNQYHKLYIDNNNNKLYGILLDGRLLHTPKGNIFSFSNKNLLVPLINEWKDLLGKLHRFRSLPITLCLSSHIDKREVTCAQILDFFEHDTLKHLPYLSKITQINPINSDNLYPLKLEYLKSISKFTFEEYSTNLLSQYLNSLYFQIQTPHTLILEYIERLSPLKRIIMESLSDEYKSFILASSVFEGVISPEVALRLSRIEETFQKSISIKHIDDLNNLDHWIAYWQQEELEMITFINKLLIIINCKIY